MTLGTVFKSTVAALTACYATVAIGLYAYAARYEWTDRLDCASVAVGWPAYAVVIVMGLVEKRRRSG